MLAHHLACIHQEQPDSIGGFFMSPKLNHLFFLLLIVCCTAFFTSCYTPAGRSPGEVVDDATITTQIKTSLLAEKILNGIAISVTTFEGDVTLTGAVQDSAQVKKATDIARSVRGVRKVDNLLKIK
jgi:hyperosmotically inducible periplasmic protein